MTTETDIDAAARAGWVSGGVSAANLDLFASMAPLSSWDIQWESHDAGLSKYFLTRLRCPRCGLEGMYHLNAVDDFNCDDEDCGFDVHDNDAGLQPSQGTF